MYGDLLHPLYENISNGICNGAKIRYQVHGYFIEKSIYARNNKMNLMEAGSVWNQFSFFFLYASLGRSTFLKLD